MTKSESFNWHRTSRICNGLHDFGLLRDKPDAEEQKPTLFLNQFSRTIFSIAAIIAAVTFLVCLILANKYQKSVNAAHHYESFVYEKEREKSYFPRNLSTVTTTDESDASAQVSGVGFRKVQNISKTIPIEEINELMPISTVLYAVNGSDTHGRRVKLSNLNELNKNLSSIRLRKKLTNNVVSLAALLKQTETKETSGSQQSENSNEIKGLQFAQLESYKHFYNMKNLQDVLNYVNCPSPENCSTSNTQINSLEVTDGGNNDHIDGGFQTDRSIIIGDEGSNDQVSDEENVISNHDDRHLDIGLNVDENDNNFELANSHVPLYYSSLFSNHPVRGFDHFYHYRPLSPLEINDMDTSESNRPNIVHRFSNRIYQRPEVQDTPRLFSQRALDPYLKPPTPPPTSISFTPSYTTAIFHGFDDAAAQQSEETEESTILDSVAQAKPISLMVEILPADDYPLSAFENSQSQYSNHVDGVVNGVNRANNPPKLPWKLSQNSQNRMRLFVHLFPQQMTPANR